MMIDELCRARSAHGLQAMMLRWEQVHPVNAVQIAWLNRTVSTDAVCAAADRVFQRLTLQMPRPVPLAVRPAGEPDSIAAQFEFQRRSFVGDWRTVLEGAITDDLNRPYDRAGPPWRLMLFDSPRDGQFLALGYRHVIADARSIVLVLHEILRQTLAPSDEPAGYEAEYRRESLRELYPEEFRLRRLPSMVWNHLSEMWASRRSFRPPCTDRADMRMEFGIHGTGLPLADLKATARRYDATINALIFAAILEWFARRYPLAGRHRRPDLAVAVLADLTGRAARPQPLAFGQYLSQFAVRLPISDDMPFEEIVGRAARSSEAAKQVGPLIDSARGFVNIARGWDLLPFTRWPGYLQGLFPLLAGVSNVHVNAVVRDPVVQSALRSYFRGTCVTSMLPMMLTLTTVGEQWTLTTTHRPAVFSREDIGDLAAHVTSRLASSMRTVLPAVA